ncbi:MAG: hypothetical protein VX766_13505 [Pseudomonadota bacterium]|nr:hypothetical protein [Pseudomonadota bacterium]
MRFVFGMCFGAVLVLFFAAGTQAGGWIERGAGFAEALREASLTALRTDPEIASTPAPNVGALPVAAVTPLAEAQAKLASGERMAGEERVWPEVTALPEAFADDYAWWAPENEAAGALTDALETTALSAPSGDGARAVADAEVIGSTGGARAQSGASLSRVAAAEDLRMNPSSDAIEDDGAAAAVLQPVLGGIAARPEQASVWTPFHSEMSANGFAQRLARALEHPFEVRRDAPGQYQVVFPYSSEAARDEMFARVAMLTGTQP